MPWTPADLIKAGDTGGWFDFSDLSTLFQLSAGTTPVTADAQPIGRVNAKYGAGAKAFDLFQSTTSSKPTYKTDGSRHWAQFDGVDWLDSGLSRFGRTGIFAAASESFSIAIACDLGLNVGTLIARASADGALKTDQLYYTSTNDLRLITRGSAAFGHPSSAAGPAFIAQRWNGAANKLRYNDNSQTANVGTAAEETAQRIVVGGRTNGTGHNLGNGSKVYQVFFIDRALTDDEEGYLARYFGDKAGRAGIGLDPPAGGNVLLSAADYAPALAFDAPALVVHAQIAAATYAPALSVNSAALTQRHVLAAADYAPAMAFVAPPLSSSVTLSPADYAPAMAIAVSPITQHHKVAGTDFAPAIAVAASPLVQRHVMAAADYAPAMAFVAPSLSSAVTLSPTDYAPGMAVVSLPITQRHSLSASAFSPSMAVSAPAITQRHQGAPANYAPALAIVAPGIGGAAPAQVIRHSSRSKTPRWHSKTNTKTLASRSKTPRLMTTGPH